VTEKVSIVPQSQIGCFILHTHIS